MNHQAYFVYRLINNCNRYLDGLMSLSHLCEYDHVNYYAQFHSLNVIDIQKLEFISEYYEDNLSKKELSIMTNCVQKNGYRNFVYYSPESKCFEYALLEEIFDRIGCGRMAHLDSMDDIVKYLFEKEQITAFDVYCYFTIIDSYCYFTLHGYCPQVSGTISRYFGYLDQYSQKNIEQKNKWVKDYDNCINKVTKVLKEINSRVIMFE